MSPKWGESMKVLIGILMGALLASGAFYFLRNPKPSWSLRPISQEKLQEVHGMLPEYQPANPGLVAESVDPNLHLDQEAKVLVSFLDEGAGYRNQLGYFTYEDENDDGRITKEEITDQGLIFPNMSKKRSGGDLETGATVAIGPFPKGTNLGFYLVANGYNNPKSQWTFYTVDTLNPDGKRHAAAFGTADGQDMVMGFEDIWLDWSDKDANDVIFALSTEPKGAMKNIFAKSQVPFSYDFDDDQDGVVNSFDQFPQDAKRAFKIRYPSQGRYFIAFEDEYPKIKDADYNDLIVAYSVEEVLNANNEVVDVLGDFALVARGACLDHAFNLGMDFEGEATAKTTLANIDGTLGLKKDLGKAKDRIEIPLFSNTLEQIKDPANPRCHQANVQPYREKVRGFQANMEVNFEKPMPKHKVGSPPYDPYLVVKKNGYDIHLPGKKPIANSKNPDVLPNFKTEEGYPFALLVPENWQFPLERRPIEEAYPSFRQFRESQGKQAKLWYQEPVSEKVREDATEIYQLNP